MSTIKNINKYTENRLSLYLLILEICLKNVGVLMLFSGIYDIYLGFKVRVDALETLIDQKILITSGLSKDKSNTKRLLAALANRLAGAVHIYAVQSGNIVLMEMMDFSKTDLSELRDEELVKVCEKIHETLNLYAPNLISLSVDANMIITFYATINLYEGKNPLPKSAIEHRKTINRLIKEAINDIVFYKKHQFDKAVNLLETSHPVFVSDYHNASRIIKDGTRHEKMIPPADPAAMAYMAGNISDANGEPLEDVTIEVFNEFHHFTTDTDEDGDYFCEGMPDGKYTVKITFEGKKTIELYDVLFKENDEDESDFTMEDDEEEVPPVES